MLPSSEIYLLVLAIVLGGMVGLAGLFMSPGHLSKGLYLLVAVAVALPFRLAEQVHLTLALTVLLISIWIFRQLVYTHRLELELSRPVIAVCSFMAVCVLAFIAGQYPWYPVSAAPMPAQLGGLGLFLLSGGIFLLFNSLIRDVDQLQRLVYFFLAISGSVFLLLTLPVIRDLAASALEPRTIGSMFWIWIVALSLGQAVANREMGRFARLGCAALAVAALSSGLLVRTGWASGWLPPLVAGGVIILLRYPRFGLAGGLLALPFGLLASSRLWEVIMLNEQYSWLTRLEAWQIVSEIVASNPILGLGPANYYAYTSQFPILGWYVNFNSHNNFVDIVAQTGLAGLFAFGWICAETIFRSLRLAKRMMGGFSSAFAIGITGGLVGSLVAGMLGDWILPFVYNIGLNGFRSSMLFWGFLGAFSALDRILRDEASCFSRVDPAISHPVRLQTASARTE